MSYVLFYEGDFQADALGEINAEPWRGTSAEISECCLMTLNRVVGDVTFVRFTDTGESDSRIARLFHELHEGKIGGDHWLLRFISIGLSNAALFGCIGLGASMEERRATPPVVFAVDPSQGAEGFVKRLREAFRENTTIEFFAVVERRR